MKRQPIFTEVLLLNTAMVALAIAAAALTTGFDRGRTGLLAGVTIFALALTCLLNIVILRRRFTPLEDVITEMEKVDLSRPGANLPDWIDGVADTEEAERLESAFLRMMRRLEAERHRSSSAALAAQEQERARVARDLHDQVNQSLTGVLLRLEATRSEAPPELAAEIEETSRLAHQAMDELLAVARQLRPTALDDLGLRAAIAGLVEQYRRPGLVTSFVCEDDPEDLDPDLQLVVYRVSQEAIGNAVRHSGAGRIEVTLARRDKNYELSVTDDGSGFTFEQATSGLGLGGMRERANLAGGSVEIQSRPGHGTTVHLTVPVHQAGSP